MAGAEVEAPWSEQLELILDDPKPETMCFSPAKIW
jgi:hypothetical protein